jgi:hypothetical protein
MADSILRFNNQILRYGGSVLRRGQAEGPVYPTDGLLAYYQFEDDLTDDSGNSYDLSATVDYSTGKIGRGLIQSKYVSNTTHAALLTTFRGNNKWTIAYWMKLLSTKGDAMPITISDSGLNNSSLTQHYYFKGDNSFNLYRAGAVKTHTMPSEIYSDNDWHHFCNVYDGANSIFYVDASSLGAISATESTGNNNRFALNGRANVWQAANLHVTDQMFIYNRALSASEVAQLYNNGNGV